MGHQPEGIKQQKINAYNVLLLCFIGLGSMTYGYTASIIGTTLGQPSFISYFELDTRSNGTNLISSMNGLFQTGGVIGTLSLPYVADRWGRKWAIAVSAIIAVVSGAILAGSTHIAVFLVFRFFAGASAFMALAAVPIWMSEVVPVNLRGALVDVHAVCLIFGYMVQGWVGFGFFFWTTGGPNTWRPPLALQCAWPLMLLCGLYWVPESPRWLVMQDRIAEAKEILYKLHADPNDPDNGFAHAEFYQIQRQIAIDKTLGNSWMHMINKPSYRKRCLLAMGTTFLIQCSGVLVINNYGPILYRNLGFDAVKQLLYPAAWLTLTQGLNIMAMFLVDLFPRQYYMGTGILGCMVTLIIEAAIVSVFVGTDNSAALSAAVAMFFIFQIPYGLCLDGKTIGWKFYLVFIIPGTIGGIIMILFFPNTKGLPLEEIAALFGDIDEVAVYQRDIVVDAHGDPAVKLEDVTQVDRVSRDEEKAA